MYENYMKSEFNKAEENTDSGKYKEGSENIKKKIDYLGKYGIRFTNEKMPYTADKYFVSLSALYDSYEDTDDNNVKLNLVHRIIKKEQENPKLFDKFKDKAETQSLKDAFGGNPINVENIHFADDNILGDSGKVKTIKHILKKNFVDNIIYLEEISKLYEKWLRSSPIEQEVIEVDIEKKLKEFPDGFSESIYYENNSILMRLDDIKKLIKSEKRIIAKDAANGQKISKYLNTAEGRSVLSKLEFAATQNPSKYATIDGTEIGGFLKDQNGKDICNPAVPPATEPTAMTWQERMEDLNKTIYDQSQIYEEFSAEISDRRRELEILSNRIEKIENYYRENHIPIPPEQQINIDKLKEYSIRLEQKITELEILSKENLANISDSSNPETIREERENHENKINDCIMDIDNIQNNLEYYSDNMEKALPEGMKQDEAPKYKKHPMRSTSIREHYIFPPFAKTGNEYMDMLQVPLNFIIDLTLGAVFEGKDQIVNWCKNQQGFSQQKHDYKKYAEYLSTLKGVDGSDLNLLTPETLSKIKSCKSLISLCGILDEGIDQSKNPLYSKESAEKYLEDLLKTFERSKEKFYRGGEDNKIFNNDAAKNHSDEWKKKMDDFKKYFAISGTHGLDGEKNKSELAGIAKLCDNVVNYGKVLQEKDSAIIADRKKRVEDEALKRRIESRDY